jgi:UDP-glucuronate decarboxylase
VKYDVTNYLYVDRPLDKPLSVDDPKVRRPDIGLARRLLSWEPEVPIDEGCAALSTTSGAAAEARR